MLFSYGVGKRYTHILLQLRSAGEMTLYIVEVSNTFLITVFMLDGVWVLLFFYK